jgi:membrane-bound serine protease (ClpP class)
LSLYVFGLLALGLVFIILEVFFPSMGMLGTLAALSIIGGGVLAYVNDPGSLFLGYVVVTFVLVPVALLTALKLFPKTPIGKHFTLAGPTFNPKDAQAVEENLDELVGLEGETITPLHPTGIALINKRRVDVVTRGEMLEKEARIKVIKVEGNRIVVEESKGGSSENA